MSGKLKVVATLMFVLTCAAQSAPRLDAQASGAMAVQEAVPAAKIVSTTPSSLDAIVARDAKIERVVSGLIWAEGPMWHKGALWFSDLSGNKMYTLTDGKLKVQLDKAGGLDSFPAGGYGGSNGMVADKDGTVLMMQHGLRRIVRLDGKMTIKPFLDKYDGLQFNSPNDLVFAPGGALYFTDPPFGFFDASAPDKDMDKDPRHVAKFDGVYRFKDGKVTAAITDLPKPNGLAFSKDGKTFYVSNSVGPRAIYKYDVKPDGTLVNQQLFFDLSKESGDGNPDGMKLDSLGDVWAAGPGGFHIISPKGELLGEIKLPEVVSNVAWGGKDGKTAYITAATSVYTVTLKISGQLPIYP